MHSGQEDVASRLLGGQQHNASRVRADLPPARSLLQGRGPPPPSFGRCFCSSSHFSNPRQRRPNPCRPSRLRSSLPATAALGRCQPLPPPSAAPGHGPVPLSLARMSGVARSAGKKAIYAADAFIPKGSLTQSRFNLLREIAIGSVLGISAGLVWKVRGDGEALGCRVACWGPRKPCSAAPGVFRLLDRPWAGGPASTSSGAHGARSARRQWRNRARRCDALPGRGRRRATPRTAPGPGSGLKHA